MESVQSIDAIAPLRESAYAETGDAGTQRPRAKPETRHGTAFQPMDLPDPERPPEISWKAVGACLTPLDLIHCFLPEWLIAQWVEWTNVAIKNGPWKQSSRENNWRDTTLAEVYCFLATLLYMGLYAENSIAAYWSEVDSYPVHFPKYFLARNRFELLFSHLRTWDPSTEEDSPLERIFARVDYLSEWLQKVSLDLLAPGAEVCVDEAMVRFTGRHHATVVIKGMEVTPEPLIAWTTILTFGPQVS